MPGTGRICEGAELGAGKLDKTERLFAIIDTLRRRRLPITAADLADEHGVSVRTLYRDVQTLIALGAPVDGEAGIGYMLRPGFFLPPLMFSADELEALVLGARWVESQPDTSLAAAASNALGKIAAASPDDLRDRMSDTGLWPVRIPAQTPPPDVLGLVRKSMRLERALRIGYIDAEERVTERTVWPVQLAYYENKQIVAAWCVARGAFRHFRTDRITSISLEETRFGERRAVLVRQWRDEWLSHRQPSPS